MQIIMGNRSSSNYAMAGDVVQQRCTAEALKRLGHQVKLAFGELREFTGDIVHLFNIMPVEETYHLFCQAREKDIPVVLSPIFWEPHEFLRYGADSNRAHFEEWWEKTREQRVVLLRDVELLLPNGRGEVDKLISEFGFDLAKHVVIPNAADKSFYFADPSRYRRRFGTERFVLCVGRICRRKNQLGLIRALSRYALNLVFIGPVDDYEYYRSCRREKTRSRLRFIDTLSHSELSSAYAAADLHVLPSWYETPGLATLEAAMAGCKVVSTLRGTAQEYLGDLAWYCDPSNQESIRDSVLAALEHPGHPELRNKVRQEFTWENVALQTQRAYEQVVGGDNNR